MARYDNNNRRTPDAVQDYSLRPIASVVDKQMKYTPQTGDLEQLRHTAQGLSKLAQGITDTNYVLQKMANENALEALAKTEEKNRADFAEVSKNIEGFAKFNPYNKEAYKGLRAKANMEEGLYQLVELEANCASLTETAFENKKNEILNQTIQKMNSEGLEAKHTADYLSKLQDYSFKTTHTYVTKKAELDYLKVQNQIVSSVSKDIASMTTTNPKGYLEGWNTAIKNLETTANGIGMNNSTQMGLFTKIVNQYITDNVDDIDTEDFIVALHQTKINGQSLADYDPNYADTMQKILLKVKRAKYENDNIDLQVENLKLQKATLHANSELFKFMSSGNRTDAEIKNKAFELIQNGGMEAVGFTFLNKIVNDKQTLLNLNTTITNPEVYDDLMYKYITNKLSQEEIITAIENKQLNAKDAYSLFNNLETKAASIYTAQIKNLDALYLAEDAEISLTKEDKKNLKTSVYEEVISNPNLSKTQKVQALERLKNIAEYNAKKKEFLDSTDPMKLLKAEYLKTQRIETQDIKEAQRYLAKLGLFKNQFGTLDNNINVTSPVQNDREVILSDGTKQTADHYGTDVKTYLGRQVYAPMSGEVVASGFTASTGNYVLFRTNSNTYIKLMHLENKGLPKAGTYVLQGRPLACVGSTGNVTKKDVGILHVELFNKKMKLVNPKEFFNDK